MRRWLAALAASLSCLGGFCHADPIKVSVGHLERLAYTKSYALLIGEVDYDPSAGWEKVPGAPRRIGKVAAALTKQGFDPGNIETRSNLDGVQLLGAIRSFIEQHADADARILIFYNGHGASLGNQTADERGYLVPVNAPAQDDAGFISRAVGLDEVKKIIANSKAKHTLVIFDSCFSGLIFDTLGNLEQLELSSSSWASFRKPRVQIITAGDADQPAPQDDEFVDALVAGLDGGALYAHSTVITAEDLAIYLAHTVRETTVRSGSAGLESGGQFMFVKPVSMQPAEAIAPVVRTAENFATKVRYYKKSLDGLVVLRALDKSGLSYEARHPEIGDIFTTNSLGCGKNTDIQTVKALAKELVKDGVPLRMIYRFRQGDTSRSTIDLVTSTSPDNIPLETPILTEQQIDALRTCPASLWTGQHSPNDWPTRSTGN